MILQTDFPGTTSEWTAVPLQARSTRREVVLSAPSVISVIDDDASVRAAIDNLLRSRGYIVHAFASAEEFLRSPHLAEMSCVIADVQMSGMSGAELLSDLRGRGYEVPFILITGFPDEGVRARALKAGAVCFLSKPFAAPSLMSCLDTALGGDRGGTRA
jgi:FixJ family two-component response regulator